MPEEMSETVKALMKVSYELATDKDAWYQDDDGKWHLKDEHKTELPKKCKECLADPSGYDPCDFNGMECHKMDGQEWIMAHGEKFHSMLEMKEYVRRKTKPIKEWLCPNFDLEVPTEKHLAECENGAFCENRWGCHTYRHLRGSRSKV